MKDGIYLAPSSVLEDASRIVYIVKDNRCGTRISDDGTLTDPLPLHRYTTSYGWADCDGTAYYWDELFDPRWPTDAECEKWSIPV